MENQNEKQDPPSATIHFSGETLVKEIDDSDLIKLQRDQLMDRVKELKKQLSTAQNIVDEQTNSQRQIVNDTIVEHREQMYTLFESIPHLNVWIEGLIRGLLLDMQFEGTIVDSDDVRAIVEEEIDDAKEDAQTIATEKIEGLIKDALDSVEVESHLIY